MNWNQIFEDHFKEKDKQVENDIADEVFLDPSHDILHIKRVVKIALQIGELEHAKESVLLPAAWFHDYVNVPKNSSLRSQASRISADKAIDYLKQISYPNEFFDEIHHAICAHSFSANIEPKTIEAKILQDADRLDGLGAIGIARCFAVSGILGRSFFSDEDPFCKNRQPNDSLFALDHFYKKLFLVADQMKTESGKKLGKQRAEFMRMYLDQLSKEI